MIDQIITERGHRLGIGRIHRSEIDRFAGENAPPEPPTKTAAELGIPVFGGTEDDELILDWNDPEYLEAAKVHNLAFWDDRLDYLAPAIALPPELLPEDLEEIAALQEIGKILDPVGLLRFVIFKSEADAAQAVLAVLYNSTVTTQGIDEAAERYGVKWKDQPVTANVPASPLWAGREFSDRRTARYCGYTWGGFCELTGPEQSSLAAFHWIDVRVKSISLKG